MRKGRKFTPTLLKSWKKKNRGEGLGANYTSWHQITRADPGSMGKSRIQNNNLFGRSMDFLSDTEFAVFCFAQMLPNVCDVREQYPLNLLEHPCDISTYLVSKLSTNTKGTLEIANSLGISHPRVKKNGEAVDWVMTTDLLVTIKDPIAGYQLLALSVKDKASDHLSERQINLLQLEREYWTIQGVNWLLITPEVYCKSVAVTLKTYAPYAISDSMVDKDLITKAMNLIPLMNEMPLSKILLLLEDALNVSQGIAQKVFWQGVWKGVIPIDLRRKPTPLSQINLLSYEDFWLQNPVVAGRSSCL